MLFTENIFDGLNARQEEAVNYLDGPLLVMAGAGSGKTRVLTCRIANLLALGVSPWNILAITFTNKAANEMKSRAAKMIGEQAQKVWLSTFHSFCARILRNDVETTGLRRQSFVIYDTSDSRALIRNIIKEFNLDETIYNPASVQGRISSAKNNLNDAAEFFDNVMMSEDSKEYDKNVAKIYRRYEKQMIENNAADFDDLLLLAVQMLKDFPDIRRKYQNRFQYILIDEYQDTNLAQYQLSKLLAAAHHNICVVGDADQSIYGFRGADIRNILSFEKDYPEAKVVMLEQNYRSTKTILNAANAVIENNENRKPKTLWTQNPTGDRITFFKTSNERDEAKRIIEEIKSLAEKDISYRDIALLYRINAQSRALEEAFLNSGIPYIIVGGLKFYERKEIKNIIAYLRVVCNPEDSISLQRIINVPKRGLGLTTLGKLNKVAETEGLPLFDVISDDRLLAQASLMSRARKNLREFTHAINEFIERKTQFTLPELVLYILNASGYISELQNDPTPENAARVENLGEFVNVAKEFAHDNPDGTLEDFLNHIALISDLDNLKAEKNCVSLMTVHSAKGLEFPIVFITGFEDGLFPHSNSFLNKDDLEEERRAAYVAITRAKKKLYLTYTAMRSTFGKERLNRLSRFFDEIPPELINAVNFTVRQEFVPRAVEPPPLQNVMPVPKRAYVPKLNADWVIGARVRHVKWGSGTITAITGSGPLTKLTVRFDDESIGRKNLILQFAPLEKI